MARARDVTMIVCTALALAGAVAAWWVGSFPTPRIRDLRGVERPTKLHFPPGTELVEARVEKTMDWNVWATLTMPRGAVNAFVQAARLSVPRDPEGREYIMGFMEQTEPILLGMKTWHPLAVKRRLLAYGETGPSWCGPEIFVLADLADPHTAVIYINAFTM